MGCNFLSMPEIPAVGTKVLICWNLTIVSGWFWSDPGPRLIYVWRFPSYLRMVISMLKIRRPLGRLIFNMGIAIPGKTVFLIETAPWAILKRNCRHFDKVSRSLAALEVVILTANDDNFIKMIIFPFQCISTSFTQAWPVDIYCHYATLPRIWRTRIV